MARYHMTPEGPVAYSKDEEDARDAEEKEWEDKAAERAWVTLRRERDEKIAESDYMGNSDVTMSDAWTTYRQALRDITSQTPSDNALSNITFPTKPS